MILELDFSQLTVYEKIPIPAVPSGPNQQHQLRNVPTTVESWNRVLENILNGEGEYIMRILPNSSLEKRERQRYFETIKVPKFLIQPLLLYCCWVREVANKLKITNLLVHSGIIF